MPKEMKETVTMQQVTAIWAAAEKYLACYVDPASSDYDSDSCPCCQIWIETPDCKPCPIALRVNQSGCDGTPYRKLSAALNDGYTGDYLRTFIKDEYEFLVDIALDISEQYYGL